MARSGINKVILVGNLGQDPEVKYTAGGAAVTTLSLATSESWKDKDTGTDQEKTDKALARIKAEAALLGANGIVIQSLSNKDKLYFSLTEDGQSMRDEKQKELKAIAIFVK